MMISWRNRVSLKLQVWRVKTLSLSFKSLMLKKRVDKGYR